MIIQRNKDGTLQVEIRLDYFRDKWRTTPQDDRVVLEDKRPAVRERKEDGVTLYTIHPLAWDILKQRFHELMEAGQVGGPREKLCAFCGSPLTVSRELEGLWVMVCKSCSSMATMSKSEVGGTIGQGEKEKV